MCVCVKFGDPSYIGFYDIVWKTDRQTNKQTHTPLEILPTLLPSAWVIMSRME